MKIGIIGSSHSYGNNGYPGPQTSKVDDQLNKLMLEHTFINFAHPGKGSEMFANTILYLKETHKVDAILMENIANRSSHYIYNNIYTKDFSLDESRQDYFKAYGEWEKGRLFSYIDSRPELMPDVPRKKYKSWSSVNQIILGNRYAQDAKLQQSYIDIYYARKLCNALNITTIEWSMFECYGDNSDHPTITCVDTLLQKELGTMAYRKKQWSVDNVHLNSYWQEQVLKKYIIPAIKYKLEKNND